MTQPWHAPAKLNLFLHVTGKQADGYHTLQSLVCFTSLADELTFAPASTFSLKITGPFAGCVSIDDNLVLRAARALSSTKSARITLTKNIPVGAGLGGGSSDAATTLLALNKLWKLNKPIGELEKIARTLGSDVPVCLRHTPQLMEGTGHSLTPARIPKNLAAVLVYPNQPLSTKEVYANCIPSLRGGSASEAIHNDQISKMHNDLEPAAFKLMPQLSDILNTIRSTKHCKFARMSGSGSTCFGLYESIKEATQAARDLQTKLPNCWVKAVSL